PCAHARPRRLSAGAPPPLSRDLPVSTFTDAGRSPPGRALNSTAPRPPLPDADDFASTLPPTSTLAVGRRYACPPCSRPPSSTLC
ncbi:hypothetical protein C8Q78DRAFT_986847, partial [Trametes maxima]